MADAKKSSCKVTFEMTLNVTNSAGGVDEFKIPLEYEGEALDKLNEAGFFTMSDDEKYEYLLNNDPTVANINAKFSGDFANEIAAWKIEIDTDNPIIELTIDGETIQMTEKEYQKYLKDQSGYIEDVEEKKARAKAKLEEKRSKDQEFYDKNTYNKKYVSRSSDLKTIMVDEDDYRKVIEKINTNLTYYDSIKTGLNEASKIGKDYKFVSTVDIPTYISNIEDVKGEEEKLAKRIDMSILVLKNCDEDTKNYLEQILVDKIFSMDFKEKSTDGSPMPEWEVFENAMDDLLKEVERDLTKEIDWTLKYAKNLWDFSKYDFPSDMVVDGKLNPKYFDQNGPTDELKNKIVRPKGVTVEDALKVYNAMLDLNNVSINGFQYDNPTGQPHMNNMVGVYEVWRGDIVSIAKYFYDHSGTTPDAFFNRAIEVGDIYTNALQIKLTTGEFSNTHAGKLIQYYSEKIYQADQLQKSLNTVKSMRKSIPYIKYTATDEYAEIYDEFRKAGYTDGDEVNVVKALNNLGITGLDTEKMKYMTVNEMALYAYLKKYNNETVQLKTGVSLIVKEMDSSSAYLDSIVRNLDQRQADYEAYQNIITLLNDGEISIGEKVYKTLDGLIDGLVQYGLNISRAFTTFTNDARPSIEELKEAKIAEFLLTFRNEKDKDANAGDISSKDWNKSYYQLCEMAHDYREMTDSEFEAISKLYDFVTNNSNAYGSIAAYNHLYSNAKSFGTSLCTTTVAVIGKALSTIPTAGPILEMVCSGINATEQFGKTAFKLYDATSDDNNVGAIFTKSLFAALNSYYINKKFIDASETIFGRETVQDILFNTFCVETLKNLNITVQNVATDIVWGEDIDESDISMYKFVKAIPDFMKKISNGELTFEEGLIAVLDIGGPYLLSLGMKGLDFKNGGIKNAEQKMFDAMVKPFAEKIERLQERNRNRDQKR